MGSLGRNAIGYFEIVVEGEQAEQWGTRIKIGRQVSIRGSLWARSFRDREGNRIHETKVILDLFKEGYDEKNGRKESGASGGSHRGKAIFSET
jgi:single-stranded DNA-binding protein